MWIGSLRMNRSPLDKEEKYWKKYFVFINYLCKKICLKASQELASCLLDNASRKPLLKQIGQCLVT